VRFAAASGSLRFSFGHDGGDCTPKEGERKEISGFERAKTIFATEGTEGNENRKRAG